jgi:hypothetical protein
MDTYLIDQAEGDLARGKEIIDEIVDLCRRKKTVMNVLWHQRIINPQEFPVLHDLYVYILETAQANNGAFILPFQMLPAL